jgi:hypothetical protein
MRWILFLAGMALFVVSFFLIAVKDAKASRDVEGMPGYKCASTTLLAPWGSDGMRMLRDAPSDFFALLFSGWINPVFLLTLAPLLIRPRGRLAAVLRIVLMVMFIAPWIVFYRADLRPRAGYFLWTAAMLMVLFSNKLVRPAARTSLGKTVDKNANIS